MISPAELRQRAKTAEEIQLGYIVLACAEVRELADALEAAGQRDSSCAYLESRLAAAEADTRRIDWLIARLQRSPEKLIFIGVADGSQSVDIRVTIDAELAKGQDA